MAKWRILAIDDRADTLEIIRATLDNDYDVVTLLNPYEAFDILSLFEPDAILLDIIMPRLSGFKLLELLKGNVEYRNIPVIVLSCKDGPGDIKLAYKIGAALYLSKPFEPERLKRNIELFFNHTPPPRKPKRLAFTQVVAQVRLLKSFHEGIVALPGHLLSTSEIEEPEEEETYEEREEPEHWVD